MLTPYMESGYYPHTQASWNVRLRVCWRILRYGEFFPQPDSWYESLHKLVTSPLSMCVKQAVEKVTREDTQDNRHKEVRLQEAQQWARTYLLDAKLYSHNMRQSTINFLIEWWVLRTGGTLS